MTENELKLELLCYQTTIDSYCDIDNLSLSDWAKFLTAYLKVEEISKETPISHSLHRTVNRNSNFHSSMTGKLPIQIEVVRSYAKRITGYIINSYLKTNNKKL